MSHKHHQSAMRRRFAGYILGLVGVFGLIATIFIAWNVWQEESQKKIAAQTFPEQESVIPQSVYPNAHIGYDGQFWEYTITPPETEYEERQQVLDTGGVTLWPSFSEENLMWFSAHHPGTFSHLAENIQVGQLIELTTPLEHEGRHHFDHPDVLTYEIVERIDTDIWAEDVVSTTGMRATDMYNAGYEEPSIMIQHSGEDDEMVVLYFGTLVKTEEGQTGLKN